MLAFSIFQEKEDRSMKCLRKYDWVKLPRSIPDMGKGNPVAVLADNFCHIVIGISI